MKKSALSNGTSIKIFSAIDIEISIYHNLSAVPSLNKMKLFLFIYEI